MDMLIDKQKVANSFSRAAMTYDSVAELQRDVGHALMAHLPKTLGTASVQRVMDLGCGTGFFSPKLKQVYPEAELLNVDLAFGMLRYAREERAIPEANWVCADAEHLPFANNSMNLVFSSLAIQWCADFSALMKEIERVLAPGGQFVFATLGPSTLCELRRAWGEADSYTHVNQFLSSDEHLVVVPENLKVKVFDEELRVLRYPQLKGLTDELKRLGAHNMNAGQQVGLTGRERVRRFKAAYEAQRLADGSIPATYQVYYAVFEKILVEQYS